jgi:Tfp pilus assembly protein PilP
MKRTLAVSLFLTLTLGALAQTATVVEKPADKRPAAKPAAQAQATVAKPSPATVKAAPNQKSVSAPAKPAVVAVPPATNPFVPGAKPNTTAAAKVVAAAPQKTALADTSAHKVVVAPAAHPVGAQKASAVAVNGSPVKAVPQAKNPFNAGKTASKAEPANEAKSGMTTVAVKDNKPAMAKKPESKRITAAGRRDPFVSPVVTMAATGSGCISGKRCLAIDQIALRGVVKSDTGMIAVVVNAMDKAYFLRENDPVFNGYVVKITGDSIIFKETFHDKLGKPLTRDVTKSISRPVA